MTLSLRTPRYYGLFTWFPQTTLTMINWLLAGILVLRESLEHCSCENGQNVSFLINALLNTAQLNFRLCTGSQPPLAEGVNRLGYQAQIILKRN